VRYIPEEMNASMIMQARIRQTIAEASQWTEFDESMGGRFWGVVLAGAMGAVDEGRPEEENVATGEEELT
jgi:hypothetical protein